jgi:hypothetical protein
MRKTILFVTLLLTAVFFTACDDTTTSPEEEEQYGDIALFSTPSGASIFVNNVFKGNTPDTISLPVGVNDINFSLVNYEEKTVSIAVSQDNLEVLSVELTPEREYFGVIKIWETGNGSTVDQPSGIDLSAGTSVAISGADSLNVDIYYTGSNLTIRSAGYLGENYRVTYFYEGNVAEVSDGVDAPEFNESDWALSMPDDVSGKYYFLYDTDGNYTKFKVLNSGGGTGWGDPKWVEVEWIYNKPANERRF